MSWLDSLFSTPKIQVNSIKYPKRSTLDLSGQDGSTVSVTDDPTNDQLNVQFTGGLPQIRFNYPGDASAGATLATFVFDFLCDAGTVSEVWIMPLETSTLTANDGNYATIQLEYIPNHNIEGEEAVAEITTKTIASGGSGDWDGSSFAAITVPLVGDALSFPAHSSFCLSIYKIGVGIQLPPFVLVVKVV